MPSAERQKDERGIVLYAIVGPEKPVSNITQEAHAR